MWANAGNVTRLATAVTERNIWRVRIGTNRKVGRCKLVIADVGKTSSSCAILIVEGSDVGISWISWWRLIGRAR